MAVQGHVRGARLRVDPLAWRARRSAQTPQGDDARRSHRREPGRRRPRRSVPTSRTRPRCGSRSSKSSSSPAASTGIRSSRAPMRAADSRSAPATSHTSAATTRSTFAAATRSAATSGSRASSSRRGCSTAAARSRSSAAGARPPRSASTASAPATPATDDRANYSFQQPYGRRRSTSGRRGGCCSSAAGSSTRSGIRRPGEGTAPSVEEVYTPATLPGLGAKVTYLHTQGTVALDWRTAAGLLAARRLLRRHDPRLRGRRRHLQLPPGRLRR